MIEFADEARPIYETQEDLAKELLVMEYLKKQKGIAYSKRKAMSVFDFDMYHRGKHIGYCEIKCRSHDADRYGAFIISKKKWDTMLKWSLSLGYNFYLVVDFNNGVRFINYQKQLNDLCKWVTKDRRGRTDRGDPKDIEEVVVIPMWLFSKV